MDWAKQQAAAAVFIAQARYDAARNDGAPKARIERLRRALEDARADYHTTPAA